MLTFLVVCVLPRRNMFLTVVIVFFYGRRKMFLGIGARFSVPFDTSRKEWTHMFFWLPAVPCNQLLLPRS